MNLRLWLALVALFVVHAASAVETLTLENGRSLTGEVLRASDRAITLKSSSGVQTYTLQEFDAASRKHLLETVLTNALPPPVVEGTASPEIERPALPGPRAASDEPADVKSAARLFGGMFGAAIAGYVLLFVSYVWFIVLGFRESVLWGVLNLLVPFAPLVFALLHFRASVGALLCFAAGIGVIVGAPALAFWFAR